MKLKIALLGLSLAGFSQAASTIAFSGTTNFATNFLNGSGVNSILIWGVLVDSTGNGFLEGGYLPGFSLAAGSGTNAGAPVALSTSGGVTDDYLVMSGNLMNLTTSTTDGAAVGLNRITGLNSFNYVGTMNGGDAFKIIWFNRAVLGGSAAGGEQYGTFQTATLNTLPPDPTASISYQTAFAGADVAKPMTFVAVPEPSAVLLGAISALGLLRRRRN